MNWARTTRFLTAMVTSTVAATLLASPAVAARDTTPPRLTLPPSAQFVQGAALAGTSYIETDAFTHGIPMTVGWSARDASGICGYDLWEDRAYQDPDIILSRSTSTSYSGSTSDYTNQYGSGGGGWLYDWRIVAHDCAGNTSTKQSQVQPAVIQENGYTPSYASAVFRFTGNWQSTNCTCYSAGHAKKTSSAGAAVTITFDAAANRAIGLAMEKASNRGRFTVYVDGVKRGTVDTFSGAPLHRVIVWTGRVTTTGEHVLRLVNQGTSGRPRIDLDAFLLS